MNSSFISGSSFLLTLFVNYIQRVSPGCRQIHYYGSRTAIQHKPRFYPILSPDFHGKAFAVDVNILLRYCPIVVRALFIQNFALATAIIAVSGITLERNAVWKDRVALAEDTAKKSPGKERAWNHLGEAYAIRGGDQSVWLESLLCRCI